MKDWEIKEYAVSMDLDPRATTIFAKRHFLMHNHYPKHGLPFNRPCFQDPTSGNWYCTHCRIRPPEGIEFAAEAPQCVRSRK